MKTTAKTRSTASVCIANGVEFVLQHKPHGDVVVSETDTGYKVGYKVLDDCPINPLEDDDGYGIIYHHPRSRYGKPGNDYYYALNLDKYENPILDEDKLQASWHDAVMAVPTDLFTLPPDLAWEGHQEELRDQLANEEAGDYSIGVQCRYAWAEHDLTLEIYTEMANKIKSVLVWSYEDAEVDARLPPDKDVIMLDLYDHSGCTWSISGTGTLCQWDASRWEAVWVPDKCILGEAEHLAEDERKALMLKRCEEALKIYNAWSNGDVFELYIETFDKGSCPLSCEPICTYYGGYDADKFLEEELK